MKLPSDILPYVIAIGALSAMTWFTYRMEALLTYALFMAGFSVSEILRLIFEKESTKINALFSSLTTED